MNPKNCYITDDDVLNSYFPRRSFSVPYLLRACKNHPRTHWFIVPYLKSWGCTTSAPCFDTHLQAPNPILLIGLRFVYRGTCNTIILTLQNQSGFNSPTFWCILPQSRFIRARTIVQDESSKAIRSTRCACRRNRGTWAWPTRAQNQGMFAQSIRPDIRVCLFFGLYDSGQSVMN